jgi:DNA repair photolyase
MVREIQVSSVLNKHKKRDSWFLDEYSVNPYEGCSVNCLYCYVRGSKYGENMEEGMAVKTNALEILDKQLASRARRQQYGIVTVGSAVDAYMRQEEKYKLTEGILKLLIKHRFPAFISTKSKLILRDIELLKQIDQHAILPDDLKQNLTRGLIVSVSVSTTNEKISKLLEPGAAMPTERFALIHQLKEQGFLCGVNAIPTLPFISDSEEELEKTIVAAKNAGADFILIGGLTLFGSHPADSRTLFFNFLKRYDASLIPGYQKLYGINFFPPKYYLEQLKQKADLLCKKHQVRNSILEQDVKRIA